PVLLLERAHWSEFFRKTPRIAMVWVERDHFGNRRRTGRRPDRCSWCGPPPKRNQRKPGKWRDDRQTSYVHDCRRQIPEADWLIHCLLRGASAWRNDDQRNVKL